jgi:hypothetical protein
LWWHSILVVGRVLLDSLWCRVVCVGIRLILLVLVLTWATVTSSQMRFMFTIRSSMKPSFQTNKQTFTHPGWMYSTGIGALLSIVSEKAETDLCGGL